ncbi:uncharacterized protein LOC132563138 [Ylistrum balloti]|uniref:uncharacterized protein LOC132563138 n=1 Tax=Ylistrum balloti TaxID=509963 RepID=UPI002905D12A|nr:uncharacterized protein LOC132563138 [Ylistrum balloti]
MFDFDNRDNIPPFGEELRDAIDKGDIVGLRQTICKGADIKLQFGKYHATPLHFACKKQSLEIVEELIKKGADINSTDGINDRPLHEAVRFGVLSVLSFLLEKKADPDVQNNYGDSPLMYCFDTARFRANGWTKKAKVLLKHGAMKDLKNNHGKVAADNLYTFLEMVRNGKSIEKEITTPEELAEAYHLYDVLSEADGKGEQLLLEVVQSLDADQPTCHNQNLKEMCKSALSILRTRDWTSPWEMLDDVPSEIHQLGTITEDMFLRSMATKHVQPKYIRLMVVGDVGVGKTSLCLNLIDEAREAAPTDGINVFIQNYIVDMKTGKWQKLSDKEIQNVSTKILSTVCRAENKSKRRNLPQPATSGETAETEVYLRANKSTRQASDSPPTPPAKRRRSDSDKTRITLKKVNTTGMVRDEDAFLSIWDFAGDEIYEATHHIFMSPDAVYIIVFNAEACLQDDRNLDNMYKWQDVIRTYSTNFTRTKTSHKSPPIILVGSHLDRLGDSDEKRKKSKIQLMGKMKQVSSSTQLYFVDNTNKHDSSIQRIRDEIVTSAKFQENWNKRIPATWVAIDIELRMLKQQKRYIMRFSEVLDIDKRNEVSIDDTEEMKSCLRYMHLTGHILFFENELGSSVESFIVTHPQWIVDAFRCIIKAVRFVETHDDDSLRLHITQFQMSGILIEGLLKRLWRYYETHQDILIEIMQRLQPLVAVDKINNELAWIVPSMLKSTNGSPLFQAILSHPDAVVSKTLCFVFKSNVLPAIYDKLLAGCLSSKLKIKTDKERKSIMGRGTACFILNRACDLLLSCKGSVVSCTLVSRNRNIHFGEKCSFVRKILCNILKDIFKKFHHGNLEYELCLHCRHDICDEDCPVPIIDIEKEGNVTCCENSPGETHSLDKSDVEPWINPEKVRSLDYDLPTDVLHSQPTDWMIAILSDRFIGDKYNLLFLFLGLNSTVINTCRGSDAIGSVICNLFERWRNDKGKDATLIKLFSGMREFCLDVTGAEDAIAKEYKRRSSEHN